MMRPPPRGAHVRQHGADQLDARREVGSEDGLDLRIAELLGSAEHAVSGVADHDVDAAEIGDGPLDDCAQRRGVADVEQLDA